MMINFKTKSGYDLPAFPEEDIFMIANDAETDEWHVTIRITGGMGRAMQNEMWKFPYHSDDLNRNP